MAYSVLSSGNYELLPDIVANKEPYKVLIEKTLQFCEAVCRPC